MTEGQEAGAQEPMDFVLETERTTIRPWRLDEADVLHDIRSRMEVAQWLGNGDEALSRSVEDARDQIQRSWALATPAVPRGCAIVPNDASSPVGMVLLSPVGDADEVEVGWQLHPDATGKGWASEAAAAMLAHGLAHHPRVWADMWPANEPSARVAQRLGMHDLGQVLDPWYGQRDHPQGRIFVALRDGSDVEAGLEQARADLRGWAAAVDFPELDAPFPATVLPGWRETAARLWAEADLDASDG